MTELQSILYNQVQNIIDYPRDRLSKKAVFSYLNGAVEDARSIMEESEYWGYRARFSV